MKRIALLAALALTLPGCVVGTIAGAAVDVAALPVKVASAGIDAATTSQAEADRTRGRALRMAEEAAGRQARLACEAARRRGEPCPPAPRAR
jgi:predicted small secreted protein